MGSTWWSSADAEHLTLSEEHAATGGDHYGTVQTSCPICVELARLREERDPPIEEGPDGDENTRLRRYGSAHV